MKWFLLILVPLVFLLGCSMLTKERCDGLATVEEKDSCFGRVAEDQKDYLLCLEIEGQVASDTCLKEVGILLQEPAICNLVASKVIGGTCKKTIALSLGNMSLCEGIVLSDIRERCVERLS